MKSSGLILAVLSLALSIEGLVVLALVLSFLPLAVPPEAAALFPRHLSLVLPEREMLLFRVWILMALAIQAGLYFLTRGKGNDPQHAQGFNLLTASSLCCCGLYALIGLIFFLYGDMSQGRGFLIAACVISFFSKIFLSEISRAIAGFKQRAQALHPWISDGFVMLFLILAIAVPKPDGILARIFMGDYFHHWDSGVLAQAYVASLGGVMNVDVYSQYGVGSPVIIAFLMKLLGGVGYEQLLVILIWGIIIYFVVFYLFLKFLLKSRTWALTGVVLALNWQMFHPGVYPSALHYVYSTVLRYPLDMLVFILLLAHLRGPQQRWIYLAAGLVGAGLFYLLDTGLYLFLTFSLFVVLNFMVSGRGRGQVIKELVLPLVLPVILFGVVIILAQGQHLFSPIFWENLTERYRVFLTGHGNLPMTSSLKAGVFGTFMMSLVLPMGYLMAILLGLPKLWAQKKMDEKALLIAICFYGLLMYHYYVLRSAPYSFFAVCLPFVVLLCFSAQHFFSRLAEPLRPWVSRAALGLAFFLLFLNPHFLSYPNFLQLSRNPMVAPAFKPQVEGIDHYFNHGARRFSEGFKFPFNSLGQGDERLLTEVDFATDKALIDYFHQEFAFPADVALIKELTPANSSIALISAFETRLLLLSARRSLFYYFPIIDSHPMTMRMWAFSSLWTKERLERTLKELRRAAPEYVFIEKIYWQTQLPSSYPAFYPEMMTLMQYCHQHYEPYRQGNYLMALKKISF